MRNIDELFSGLEEGDFTVLSGNAAILPLSLLLCVRAQLPRQLGGLGTDVVFIDGGNTFRLYNVSRLARIHQLNPRQVLERIHIARAFTAYQLTSLLLDKVDEAAKRFGAKLVVISDITGLFLDKGIPENESRSIFSHVTASLSAFAQEKHLVLMATCFLRKPSPRNLLLRALVCDKANVVTSVRKGMRGLELVLEKHPRSILGYAEFPSENLSLSKFMED
jgi:hypothetical protein